MTTLKRELRLKFEEVLTQNIIVDKEFSEEILNTTVQDLATDLAETALKVFFPVEAEPLKPAQSALPLEWKILADLPIEKEDVQGEIIKQEALTTFEAHMKFGHLPWDSNRTWEKFSKFVVQEYEKDPQIFLKYKIWAAGEGKYHALSNKKIRENPDHFISCFPDFLAHSHLHRRDIPTSERTDLDENGVPLSYS